MRLSLRDIAEILKARLLPQGAQGTVTGISTDSRTVADGDLFIPLTGPRFDGHDYISEAVRKGAVAFLAHKDIGESTVPRIVVDDTLQALGDLAAAVRRGFDGPVVGITGSSGKTTTKEMLAGILSLIGPGLKNPGNFNNLVGLPLTVFKMNSALRWAVLEMGMSARGEIARLAQIADPSVGVITNIGPAHLETLKNLDGVARAKGELFAALKRGGVAVVNADDPRVAGLPVANGVATIRFGISPQSDVRGEELSTDPSGVAFRLVVFDKSVPVHLKVPGRHNVSNALAAAAAATALDIDIDVISRGLEGFCAVSGRMETSILPQGITLVEDTYNANPLSVRAALESFDEMGGEGRRIGVLGDMLELGETSASLHRETGQVAARHLDILVVMGDMAEEMVAGASKGGLKPDRIVKVTSHEDAAESLRQIMTAGDRILVKGSRGMKMEEVCRLLRSGKMSINEKEA